MSADERVPAIQLNNKDLSRILEVARRLGSERDLDLLLELILTETCDLLDAERASLFLYDSATDELFSKIAQGSEIGEIRFPASTGVAGYIAQKKVCLNIPDAYSDPRFNPEPDKATGWRTRNIAGCPMLDLDGNLVGVLEVLNKRGGPFTGYDEYVLSVVGSQAGVALDRARLQTEYLAKIEIERDLTVARSIQQALLPHEIPEIECFDIAGWSEPADQTGGDIYDLFRLKCGSVGFLLGDATGHGIGPALMISEARAAIRALAAQTNDLGVILAETNELLAYDVPDGRFVTLFLGLIDCHTHEVIYSSAGQGPTFLLRDGGRRIDSLEPTGLPLGILPDQQWPAQRVEMSPGDTLLVISDGIVECADPRGGMLGNDPLLEAVKGSMDTSAAEMVQAIAQLTEGFAAGSPFLDDRTAIVIKRVH
jgi:phosphoserine phosphatase RsbU/P